MTKLERRLKAKERFIRDVRSKVLLIENQLRGLEEERLFCALHKGDVIGKERPVLALDTDVYKYFRYWPGYFFKDEDNKIAGAATLVLRSEYLKDGKSIRITLQGSVAAKIEDAYSYMHGELMSDLSEQCRLLSTLYEDYGKMVYESKFGNQDDCSSAKPGFVTFICCENELDK